MMEHRKRANSVDNTDREKLRWIGDGLRHVHAAELVVLPADVAEVLKRLGS